MSTEKRPRSFYLSTFDLHRLELACAPLWKFARGAGDGGVYIVGSVWNKPDFRDVDVRMMLSDEAFDRLFGHAPGLWSLFCYAVTCQLRADTGLPIDFQVQRQTEANEQHNGPRNPVGMGIRDFAGLGDATKFGGSRDIFEALGLSDEQRQEAEDKLRAEYARIAESERAAAIQPPTLIGGVQ